MSQEKVDRYKEQKKNRKAIQAKKKRKALIEKICVNPASSVIGGQYPDSQIAEQIIL